MHLPTQPHALIHICTHTHFIFNYIPFNYIFNNKNVVPHGIQIIKNTFENIFSKNLKLSTGKKNTQKPF